MAHVVLIGNLRQYTGGVTELELAANSVRQLFRQLGAKYPELAPHLEDGLAVAIDGRGRDAVGLVTPVLLGDPVERLP